MKNLFQCSKCFYNPNTFIPFIKNKEKVLDTKNINDSLKVSNTKNTKTTNPIVINIFSNDEGYFPILCYPDDLFKNVLNEFFKDYPQYNLDNCYFLGHAERMQPNLTISENGIKNKENIQLKLKDNDNDDVYQNYFDSFDEDNNDNDYQAYND